jgi:hypothetical protein
VTESLSRVVSICASCSGGSGFVPLPGDRTQLRVSDYSQSFEVNAWRDPWRSQLLPSKSFAIQHSLIVRGCTSIIGDFDSVFKQTVRKNNKKNYGTN